MGLAHCARMQPPHKCACNLYACRPRHSPMLADPIATHADQSSRLDVQKWPYPEALERKHCMLDYWTKFRQGANTLPFGPTTRTDHQRTSPAHGRWRGGLYAQGSPIAMQDWKVHTGFQV